MKRPRRALFPGETIVEMPHQRGRLSDQGGAGAWATLDAARRWAALLQQLFEVDPLE